MAEHKMVVVDGVRYRPEDAPKREERDDEKGGEVAHKARRPRRTAES